MKRIRGGRKGKRGRRKRENIGGIERADKCRDRGMGRIKYWREERRKGRGEGKGKGRMLERLRER